MTPASNMEGEMSLIQPSKGPTPRVKAASYKNPPRPLSTYRWEEVRRARARGGYPWTHLQQYCNAQDHEYEIVSLPPPLVRVTGPNERDIPELGSPPGREGSNSSNESRERRERRYLRRPLDDELVGLPVDGEGSEDEVMEVEEKEEPMDDRAAAVPSPGTTTGSRTDLELNTSQVDSSCLEDLPLSREARRQKRLQQAEERGPGAAARSLQRIRSQAGKLRTKMRNIKRPTFNMPERPKFNMPERPKFNFPERPKFNLPERPKFNFPERPKFNLPERPKFNFPERPKFNFPERPKFNFPNRPKFNLPERPKFNLSSLRTSSLRRPLRERQESGLTVPGEGQDVHIDTPAPSTPGKRNIFDFRTYPRIFDRKSKKASYVSAPVHVRRAHTPPVMTYDYEEDDDEEDEEPQKKPKLPPRRKSSMEQRFVGRFDELDYADEENIRPLRTVNGQPAPFDDEDDEDLQVLQRELQAGDTEEENSESVSGFRDKDFGYAITLGPVNNRAPPVLDDEEELSLGESEREIAPSSGSSSDRRRAGVLEEIDSDEFFLREKGLSQEDVAVGRYLSNEIRDAFRPAPDASTLIRENVALHEAELARSYRGTPERVSPGSKARPPRRSRSTRQRGSPIAPTAPVEEVEPRYFNTFPPNKPTRNRRRLMRQQEKERKEKEAELKHIAPPLPPKRKKRTRSEMVLDGYNQWSAEDVNPDWLRTMESQIEPEDVAFRRSEPSHESTTPTSLPAAPRRGRRQSRKTPDEDARSHASHISHASRFSHISIVSEGPDPGYAAVIKAPSIEPEPCTPPPRRAKPQRPPFPSIRRRKSRPVSGSAPAQPHFFTVPRRGPPVRPLRNYATLGPARPPRRLRRLSGGDERHDSSRDLQSGDVIQRMKERPLPPPPRPSRRQKEDEGGVEEIKQDEREEVPQESHLSAATPEDRGSEEPAEVITQNIVIDVHSDKPQVFEVKSDEVRVPTPEVVAQVSEPPKIDEPVKDISLGAQVPEETQKEVVLEAEVKEEEEQASQIITSELSSEVKEEKSEIIIPEPTAVVEEIKPQEIVAEVVPEPSESVQEVISEVVSEPTKVQEILSETVEVSAQEEVKSQAASEPAVSELVTQSIPDEVVIAEEAVKVEEVSIAIQTDPLPEDELFGEVEVDELAPQATEATSLHTSESLLPAAEPALQPSEVSTTEAHIPVISVPEISEPEISAPEPEIAAPEPKMSAPEPEISTPIITIPEMSAPETPAPPPVVSTPALSAPALPAPEPALPVPEHAVPLARQPVLHEISAATAALLDALASGRLRIELLDVAKLNVNELQAQRMQVSGIEGGSLNVSELSSHGGTLVLNSLDAPIGSLAEALMSAAQQMVPPPPPPAPAPIYQAPIVQAPEPTVQVTEPVVQAVEPTVQVVTPVSTVETIPKSAPPQESPSQASSESSEPVAISETSLQAQESTTEKSLTVTSVAPVETEQKREVVSSTLQRQASPAPPEYSGETVFTTDQVVALQTATLRRHARGESSEPPPLPPRRSVLPSDEGVQQQQRMEEPSVAELGTRLASAMFGAVMTAVRRVLRYTETQVSSASEEAQERRGLQIALCVVLILVAGIILIASFSSGSSSTVNHHWDFYMPQ